MNKASETIKGRLKNILSDGLLLIVSTLLRFSGFISDFAFFALNQVLNIAFMAVQHQCGNEYDCPCPGGVWHHEEGEDRGADGGDQCGEGGHFETERHDQPNQCAEQGGCRGEGEQDA